MPMYIYSCQKCHKNQDAFRSIDGRDRGPACKKCGHAMKRIEFAAPTGGGSDRPDVRDVFKKV